MHDALQLERDDIETQAEQWFVRMRSERRRPGDDILFRQWLGADAAHQQAYDDVVAFWNGLDAYASSPAVAELTRAASAIDAPARLCADRDRHRGYRKFRHALAAIAACMVLGIGVFLANPTIYQTQYETGVGSRQSVQLLDGTVITLNTATTLRIRYDLRERHVELDAGQAHFQVSRAQLWPFEVHAGNGVVRAIGTTFDVDRRGDEVRVTLLEGRVEVSGVETASSPLRAGDVGVPARRSGGSAKLVSGQQVAVNRAGPGLIEVASLSKATAWLSGRLVFTDERLADVVSEVNRYSLAHLHIEDPRLAEVRLSGVFRAGRAEGFIATLQAMHPVVADRRPDGDLVLALLPGHPVPERITATRE